MEDLDSLLQDLKAEAAPLDPEPSPEPTGVVVQADRALWDASCCAGAEVLTVSELAGKHIALPSPILDALRRKAVSKLHATMEAQVLEKCGRGVAAKVALKSSVTLRNGDATFDRWLLSSMLEAGKERVDVRGDGRDDPDEWYLRKTREKKARKAAASAHLDPLIPAHTPPNAGLSLELVKAGAAKEQADLVAHAMSRAATKLAHTLAKRAATVDKRGAVGIRAGTRVGTKDMLELRFGKTSVSVRAGHATKLRMLFARSKFGCNGDRVAVAAAAGGSRFDRATETRFMTCLASLLVRYKALGGSGYQAACSGVVFDVMKADFGVAMECFASPLNCRWGRFCSAFPDVDAAFGSVGSFFRFTPTSGSFEANPPFEPALIIAMQRHITSLLQSTREPLSFLVVVPTWEAKPSWQSLEASPYTRYHLRISNRSHGYKEGAQAATTSNRVRKATSDTSVFFMRNTAGHLRWPITTPALQRLRTAFTSPRLLGKQSGQQRDDVGAGGGSSAAPRPDAMDASSSEGEESVASGAGERNSDLDLGSSGSQDHGKRERERGGRAGRGAGSKKRRRRSDLGGEKRVKATKKARRGAVSDGESAKPTTKASTTKTSKGKKMKKKTKKKAKTKTKKPRA